MHRVAFSSIWGRLAFCNSSRRPCLFGQDGPTQVAAPGTCPLAPQVGAGPATVDTQQNSAPPVAVAPLPSLGSQLPSGCVCPWYSPAALGTLETSLSISAAPLRSCYLRNCYRFYIKHPLLIMLCLHVLVRPRLYSPITCEINPFPRHPRSLRILTHSCPALLFLSCPGAQGCKALDQLVCCSSSNKPSSCSA